VTVPSAAYTFAPTAPKRGKLVQFDASTSKNAVSYSWSLDGLTRLTGVKPTFAFQNAGTKKVTLTVTAANGAKASVTRSLVVG
jgi:PKD repeat protein